MTDAMDSVARGLEYIQDRYRLVGDIVSSPDAYISGRMWLLGSPDTRTDEERARELAEWRREQEERQSRQKARHEELLSSSDDLVRELAALHSPDRFDKVFRECQGCDFGGYEGEPPEWPCRTWDLVASLAP